MGQGINTIWAPLLSFLVALLSFTEIATKKGDRDPPEMAGEKRCLPYVIAATSVCDVGGGP